MPRETFPVRSKRFRRARRVQTAQHLIAAVLLATAAWGHLTDPASHHVVLPLLELATALVLIGAAIVEKVRKTHPRVAWLEFAGAAMMFVEAIAKLQQPHHLSFYVLSFLPPVILLLFGLFDARIREAFRMEANDDAFILQTHIFRKKRVRWEDLVSYRITPTAIELTRSDGGVARLSTKDVENAADATQWAEEQFVRRGLTPA